MTESDGDGFSYGSGTTSNCFRFEVEKDDRVGGRKEREVESEKKMIAGERRSTGEHEHKGLNKPR